LSQAYTQSVSIQKIFCNVFRTKQTGTNRQFLLPVECDYNSGSEHFIFLSLLLPEKGKRGEIIALREN
jgi:hypothetical protein